MFKRIYRPLLIGAIGMLSATLAAAAPAAAQTEEPRSVAVHYGDLDLTSPHGAERLNVRVRSAARAVCGYGTATGLREKIEVQHCANSALEQAKPAVELAVNAARSGQQLAENAVAVRAGR